MSKTLAQNRITVTAIDDGYTISLAPASTTIPANADGSSPVLTAAKTKVLLSRDKTNIPITIDSLVSTGCTATYSGNLVTITAIPNNVDLGEILINFRANDSSYSSSAVFSFSKAKQGGAGADGYTVILSNESHTIPASATGAVTNDELAKAQSGIRAWIGATELSWVADNATPGAGQFKYSITGTTGGTAVRIDPANFRLASITDSVALITVEINCENKVTITKVMSITRSNAGQPGTPGENGNYTEFRFAKNGSTTIPPTLAANNPAPAGWATTQPPVSIGEYLWASSATKNAAGSLLSNWATPARINGIDGAKGDQGIQGPFLAFTGEYISSKIYTGSATRIEVVKYNGFYYVARIDAGSFSNIIPTETSKWNSIGAQFDSIATGILLAELAFINNLGVENLRTAAAGRRLEIIAALNSLTFYDALDRDLACIKDNVDSFIDDDLARTTRKLAGMTFKKFYSSNPSNPDVVEITGNGVYSNTGFVEAVTDNDMGSEKTAFGSIIGYVRRAIVLAAGNVHAGVVGLANTANSFGGFFKHMSGGTSLMVEGDAKITGNLSIENGITRLALGTTYHTNIPNNGTINDWVSFANSTQPNVSLPYNVGEGYTIWFTNGSASCRVYWRGNLYTTLTQQKGYVFNYSGGAWRTIMSFSL